MAQVCRNGSRAERWCHFPAAERAGLPTAGSGGHCRARPSRVPTPNPRETQNTQGSHVPKSCRWAGDWLQTNQNSLPCCFPGSPHLLASRGRFHRICGSGISESAFMTRSEQHKLQDHRQVEVGASGSGGTSGTTAIPCVATDTASVLEERNFLEDCSRSVHAGSGFVKFNNVVTSKCWQVSAYGPNRNCKFKLAYVPTFDKAVLGEMLPVQGSHYRSGKELRAIGGGSAWCVRLCLPAHGPKQEGRAAAGALERMAPH